MTAHLTTRIRQALADADQSFANTGDAMEALTWVGIAAKHGEPIPPRIAAWLHPALDSYCNGTARTMDAALGLAAKGRPPRRARQDQAKLQGALARMYVLQVMGATIPQAAAIVAQLGEFTHATLADRYRRRGAGKTAARDRAIAQRRWLLSEIEQTLAEYPDHGVEVAQAKAAIRAMHSRGRI